MVRDWEVDRIEVKEHHIPTGADIVVKLNEVIRSVNYIVDVISPQDDISTSIPSVGWNKRKGIDRRKKERRHGGS